MATRRISIHITSKDRLSEVLILLQSLRTQTFKDWDLLLLDDASGTPYQIDHKFQCLINLLKQEGHYVKVIKGNVSYGVCYARNLLIKEDHLNNEFTARIDDDVILESNYLTKLIGAINKETAIKTMEEYIAEQQKQLDKLKQIESQVDIATGVVPTLLAPLIERETQFVKPIISKIDFDKEGNMSYIGDDLGYLYLEDEIIPTHHFRTNALYKSKINNEIKYELGLTRIGFREESFFSLRALWKGYKIGVNTKAIAWHIRTPSGGCRAPNYAELVLLDDAQFRLWAKRQYKLKGDPTKWTM